MSKPKPTSSVIGPAADGGAALSLSRSLGSSWREAAPIAQASLRRDLEDGDEEEEDALEDEEEEGDGEEQMGSTSAPTGASSRYSLTGSYRRPSFVAAGNRARLPFGTDVERISRDERHRILEEERSLLMDNNLIPPKHPRGEGEGEGRRRGLFKVMSIPGGDGKVSPGSERLGAAGNGGPSESSPLLGDLSQPYGGQGDPENVSAKWEEAVKEGKIQTTWQREAKVLTGYSVPLMATFLLQYSLTVASIFTLGHLGTEELGAVSLASMTANITGYAVYQGLATSLDTLCAQAYGSGRKKLVGLQMQRMIYFLWAITIPIAIVWLLADRILLAIVPERRVAELAGLYLKVVIIGAPGYAAFEAGKRFVQAQGLFSASLYVLIVCAPINAFLNWFFVWKLEMGFVGAPIAVAIIDNCLPLGLFVYVRFFSKNGMSCWNGFTKKAWQNWYVPFPYIALQPHQTLTISPRGPMVRLAIPGVIMVEAECLAFEILTFASSYFGVEVLAAQSILATLTNITFQMPFPLSIAASTRVANLIGATLVDAAKMTTKVAFFGAVLIGVFNVVLLSLIHI